MAIETFIWQSEKGEGEIKQRVRTQQFGDGYRGPNCGYTGRLMFDDDDAPTDDPSKDICKGCLSSCKLRFGENEELPHGGFPAVSLIARS